MPQLNKSSLPSSPLFLSFPSAESVVIGFEQSGYRVTEEDANITVCALIKRGGITESIDVRITTDITSYIGVHDTPATCKSDYIF